MAKSSSKYVCQTCGAEFAQWFGKCPSCGTWNSLVETIISPSEEHRKKAKSSRQPQKLSEVKAIEFNRIKTGITEFDRVLGGGLVPGSVILLAGDPGIGKSTLLLDVATRLNGLYVSGEESEHQIKLRAERLGLGSRDMLLLSEIDVASVAAQIEQTKPRVAIIDSIQTMTNPDLSGPAGSVGQVRESSLLLTRTAKETNVPVILVGHVTKEGNIAGPKVLEHMVDTVLYLEGERFHSFRLLRSIKNRFGPTDEVGVFEMEDKGIKEVKNPSEVFLSETNRSVPGSAIVATMEGTRPVLIEIQALVSPTPFGMPRRTVSGVDVNRVQVLLAVLSRRVKTTTKKSLTELQNYDVYVNVVGGIKINEPAVDLGICCAIASSYFNKPLKQNMVIIGEVGLLGELRRVNRLERRVAESAKLGYKEVVSSQTAKSVEEALIQSLSI